jgi:L-threonylcarbamoyladenylate synthase
VIIGADDPRVIEAVSGVLKAEGIAIMPCDTMYGIVGAVPESERRIRLVKGRGEDKPFLQLIPDVSWIRSFSDTPISPKLLKYWPGPLTIVIRMRSGSTLAVRVPGSPLLIRLLKGLGKAIYSTSVNRAGKPPLARIEDIRAEFGGDVDLIVDAGDLAEGVASTIVDSTRQPAKILRQGSLIVRPADLE